MPKYTVTLDPATAVFYHNIAQRAELPVEQVLADALFKLAGELSFEALAHKKPQARERNN